MDHILGLQRVQLDQWLVLDFVNGNGLQIAAAAAASLLFIERNTTAPSIAGLRTRRTMHVHASLSLNLYRLIS